MMRKIMILGAGIFQVPLIKKANDMGLQTIVVSPDGDYPGIEIAKKFLPLDTTDANAVLKEAVSMNISGIVTTGSDVSVPTIGLVVNHLDLNGPSLEMAQIVSSKTRFRQFLKENKLNGPDFTKCLLPNDAWGYYLKSKGRVVLKPDDSSGSRGVSILNPNLDKDQVVNAFMSAAKFSRSGIVCIEDFLEGIEVGGDAFILNGKVEFLTTTVKHMAGTIVRGHSIPGNCNGKVFNGIVDEIESVTKSLGYLNGPLNFDVMVSNESITIIEMGLRNGGNGIYDIVKKSYNIDLMENLLKFALGDSLKIEECENPKPYSSFVFGLPHKGELLSIESVAKIKSKYPLVEDVVICRKPGEIIDSFSNNANLIGYLIMNMDCREYSSFNDKFQLEDIVSYKIIE